MLKRPSDGVWAGLVVGIVIVTLLMYFDVDINSEATRVQPDDIVQTSPADARAFVAAWSRMVNGTWLVESTYSRTTLKGQTYSAAVREAQSPPDFVDASPTAITASVGGRSYTCASADGGRVSGCRDNGPATPFETLATTRVRAVQDAVDGSNASYSVQAEENACYGIYLNAGKKANGWGIKAQFCFDAGTGALSFSSVQTETGSDTTSATRIAMPIPDDLKISQPTG